MRLASFVTPAIFAVSLAAGSTPVSGQTSAPAAPAASHSAAMSAGTLPMPSAAQAATVLQTFERMRTAEQQSRALTRERMLAALSPAHRSVVAALVGQQAISANPDPVATARQLDAMLTPGERETILRIDAARQSDEFEMARQLQLQIVAAMTPEQRTAMERQKAQARATFERSLSPEQRAALQRTTGGAGLPLLSGALPLGFAGASRDPGSVLLRALTTGSGAMPYRFEFPNSVHAGAEAGSTVILHATAGPPR